MKNSKRPTNVLEFFAALYPGFDGKKQVIEIRILKEKGMQRKFCRTIAEAAQFAIELDEGTNNVYFQCAALTPEAKADNKATEEYCAAYNFLYADLDPVVKNSKGKVLATYTKPELMQRIEQFALCPSIVVDSGNGYHVYWLLTQPLTDLCVVKSLLKRIQVDLNSDPRTVLATQLLRVVGTQNKKPLKHGKPALPVRVVGGNGNQYSINEVLKAIDHFKMPDDRNTAQRTKNENQRQIDIKFFQNSKRKPQEIEFESYTDLLDFLQRQNPLETSSEPTLNPKDKFRCVVHEDNIPSANIYEAPNGKFYYKCFGCDFRGDIITLYQAVYKANFLETVRKLSSIYGLKNPKDEWFMQQLEKYNANEVFIDEFGKPEYQKLYPNLYKLLRPRLKQLKIINQYAQAKISSEKFEKDGENLFFLSYDYFAREYGFSINTVKSTINFYVTLGLIQKWDVGDIHNDLQKKALEERRRKTLGSLAIETQPVNFYTLPCLNDRIQQAEARAKTLVEYRFKFSTCMNKMFLINAFGQKFADKVYPDKREITKLSLSIASSLNNTLLRLIERQGYASRAQVISQTKVSSRLRANKKSKEREWDRYQKTILDKNNLVQVWANKAMKEKFGLSTYSPIIIPKMLEEERALA